jgi:hypothetical protein
MGLDIRLPIGLMFSLLGPVLVVTGLINGTPINSVTGAAMLVFGVGMLVGGIIGQRRAMRETQAKSVATGKASDTSEPHVAGRAGGH